jgi:FAD/FMN-containing dehydrogenase
MQRNVAIAERYRLQSFAAWGRLVQRRYPIADIRHADEASAVIAARPRDNMLAVGMGRSYGTSNTLSGGALIRTGLLDRIISFDRQAGVLRAEAGLTLSDAISVIVPHGWFLPTTPGTRFVTLGGAVANDVHGKNHHSAGTFGCAVRALGLLRSDGTLHTLTPDDDSGLFAATIGGLGLTGMILWVEITLSAIPGTNLACERTAFQSIGEFAAIAADAAARFEHTVAWIDCAGGGKSAGRGIFESGNWVDGGDKALHKPDPAVSIPMDAPGFLISGPTVKAFNTLYFNVKRQRSGAYVQHYGGFFYPLDAIGRWNRLYGRRGFHQYQCVVPHAGGIEAVEAMLNQIGRSGNASFLAVLKTFGPKASPGMLSFPRKGITLALDFPNRGRSTLDLCATLDSIVNAAGGRLYPAKDARMPRAMFEAGYPNVGAFRAHVDPAFSSDFWKAVSL